jgi:hypothetical protein
MLRSRKCAVLIAEAMCCFTAADSVTPFKRHHLWLVELDSIRAELRANCRIFGEV